MAQHDETGSENDVIPIATLDTAVPPPAGKVITAQVALVYPYSSSTQRAGILAADADPRVRRRGGQVHINLKGGVARAVGSSRIGIGDTIRLSLEGATWVDDEDASKTPGRSVLSALSYSKNINLEVSKNGVDFTLVSMPEEEPEVVEFEQSHTTPPATPQPPREASPMISLPPPQHWSSPAFFRRGAGLEQPLLGLASYPFAEAEEDIDIRPNKRAKIWSGAWRFSQQPPSPPSEKVAFPPESPLPTEDEDTEMDEPTQVKDKELDGASEESAVQAPPLDSGTSASGAIASPHVGIDTAGASNEDNANDALARHVERKASVELNVLEHAMPAVEIQEIHLPSSVQGPSTPVDQITSGHSPVVLEIQGDVENQIDLRLEDGGGNAESQFSNLRRTFMSADYAANGTNAPTDMANSDSTVREDHDLNCMMHASAADEYHLSSDADITSAEKDRTTSAQSALLQSSNATTSDLDQFPSDSASNTRQANNMPTSSTRMTPRLKRIDTGVSFNEPTPETDLRTPSSPSLRPVESALLPLISPFPISIRKDNITWPSYQGVLKTGDRSPERTKSPLKSPTIVTGDFGYDGSSFSRSQLSPTSLLANSSIPQTSNDEQKNTTPQAANEQEPRLIALSANEEVKLSLPTVRIMDNPANSGAQSDTRSEHNTPSPISKSHLVAAQTIEFPSSPKSSTPTEMNVEKDSFEAEDAKMNLRINTRGPSPLPSVNDLAFAGSASFPAEDEPMALILESRNLSKLTHPDTEAPIAAPKPTVDEDVDTSVLSGSPEAEPLNELDLAIQAQIMAEMSTALVGVSSNATENDQRLSPLDDTFHDLNIFPATTGIAIQYQGTDRVGQEILASPHDSGLTDNVPVSLGAAFQLVPDDFHQDVPGMVHSLMTVDSMPLHRQELASNLQQLSAIPAPNVGSVSDTTLEPSISVEPMTEIATSSATHAQKIVPEDFVPAGESLVSVISAVNSPAAPPEDDASVLNSLDMVSVPVPRSDLKSSASHIFEWFETNTGDTRPSIDSQLSSLAVTGTSNDIEVAEVSGASDVQSAQPALALHQSPSLPSEKGIKPRVAQSNEEVINESVHVPQQRRRSARLRKSDVPDVLSGWFESRPEEKDREDEHLEVAITMSTVEEPAVRLSGKVLTSPEVLTLGRPQEAIAKEISASDSLTVKMEGPARKGFQTPLSLYQPLSSLTQYLNNPPSDLSSTIDVLAVVTWQSKKPKKATAGPKDFSTILHVMEPSNSEVHTQVSIFRPKKEALPVADKGDVILLRNFQIKSKARECYLLNTGSSAWHVWRHSSAQKRQSTGDGEQIDNLSLPHEEAKGAPVELGDEEREHAKNLRAWWLEMRANAE